MKAVVQELYAYNEWATRRLLAAMHQLTPEEYDAPGCSGHGSIRGTFAHLLGTQRGWFSWFDGTVGPAEAIGVTVDPSEVAALEDAERVAHQVHEQLARCVDALDDDALAKVWTWDLPDGHKGALPLWKMIVHVANHSTHTRAQIVSAMGRIGKSPGNLDLIFYEWTSRT